MTEFKVNGQKVYLSPIIDLFNQEVVSYEVQTSTPEEIKNEIIEKLGNLGDKKALSPLIEIIDENDIDIVSTSLSKIVKKNKLENSKEILKFLKSNDEGMKRMGVSMLKGILEE